MKILTLHNRYQITSGEEAVLRAERKLLEENGHEVRGLEVDNSDLTGIFGKAKAAVNVIYSHSSKQKVREMIAQFQPDIVHVHNFFPLLSPSIYFACNQAGIPVVQTLHNYRLLCANATFYRDNQICEDCLDQPFGWPSVVHRCYRDSCVGSAAVSTMASVHRYLNTWTKRVDRYICLTEFARKKFIQAGLPAEKICVKPNFVYPQSQNLPDVSADLNGEPYALYVGRLWPEKGIGTLIAAWKQLNAGIQLKIVGDGPLMPQIRTEIQDIANIELLGQQSSKIVSQLMTNARLTIVPSEWYEPFGLTAIESFAVGTPVVAANLGSLGEIVVDGVTGLHFQAGNPTDLAAKIQWAIAHPELLDKMGETANCTYQTFYRPEVNYHQLLDIYKSAIAQRFSGW
jgi:glycosyltransferase involved in cell wall biosynthesis